MSAQIIGEFVIVREVEHPVRVECMKQFLAKKLGTDKYYILKELTLKNLGEEENRDDQSGKLIFFTEHSILKLAGNEPGIIRHHGTFPKSTWEVLPFNRGKESFKETRRVYLVLDCFVPHEFSLEYRNIIDMRTAVMQAARLEELKALRIFVKVVEIVERLHNRNIMHRDLKLANIVLDQVSGEVTLVNFGIAKHATSEDVLFKDMRGSPAYIPPEVLTDTPYLGKPCDMWALGVTLYTMLFGQFPFYDKMSQELYAKIKLGKYQIPGCVRVSPPTVWLIESLLVLNPNERKTATETLNMAKVIIGHFQPQPLLLDIDRKLVL